MRNKLLLATTIGVITLAISNLYATPQSIDGIDVYERKCARCHGDDGISKKRGVASLRKSDMKDVDLIDIITNGEDKMPAFKKKLSAQEIQAVAKYVKGFR